MEGRECVREQTERVCVRERERENALVMTKKPENVDQMREKVSWVCLGVFFSLIHF